MSGFEVISEAMKNNEIKYYELGELGTFYGGITGKKKEDFNNGNAKFITYKNVYVNPALDVECEDTVFIGDNENQKVLEYGDIIFTGSSETADECGISSVVTVEPKEKLYLNSFCFFFRFNDPSIMLPGFAKHLFRSKSIRYQIIKTANGVTRYNVSKKLMEKVVIPIPPLSVQEELVKILDELAESTNSLIDELNLEISLRKKQYDYYKNTLLKENARYRKVKLKDIVSICMCRRIKKAETLTKGEIPFYQNGTLGGEAKLFLDRTVYEAYRKKSKMPSIGEVMLSTAGTIGKAVVFDGEEAYYQDSNIVWLHNDEKEVSNQYLYWFCKSMPWVLPDRATLKHLHNYMIEDTDISIPPKEEQDTIIRLFQELYSASTEIEQKIEYEVSLRKHQYEYYSDMLLTFKEAV